MKKIALLVIAVALASGVLGCATTGVFSPLPKDLNIVPPDPSVGQLAKYSGAWSGNWDNDYIQATTVVLEKIGQAEVVAVYSWGSYQSAPGGWMRVSGKISGDSTIVLEWGEPNAMRTVTLTPAVDKLHAEYRRAGRINRATLTRVPISALKSP